MREVVLPLPGVEERIGGYTGAPAWRVGAGQIAWLRGPRATDLRARTV